MSMAADNEAGLHIFPGGYLVLTWQGDSCTPTATTARVGLTLGNAGQGTYCLLVPDTAFELGCRAEKSAVLAEL
jgi:hypothetical protein